MDPAVQKALDDTQGGNYRSVSKEFVDMRKALADPADHVTRVTQRLYKLCGSWTSIRAGWCRSTQPRRGRDSLHYGGHSPGGSQANSSHEDILRMMVNQMATPFQVPPPPNFSFLASDWQQWIVGFEQYRGASSLNLMPKAKQVNAFFYIMGTRLMAY